MSQAAAPLPPPVPQAPVPDTGVEELRLALALNGGVSLAIWIGGVTNEIKRLLDSCDPTNLNADAAYRDVLALLNTEPRVDVISGASAGGLNGAFLALAMVHRKPLDSLRDLWADTGSFDALLRYPLASSMPSLLKGDDYFLPQLATAMSRFWEAQPGRRVSKEDMPIDLTITTTLLHGTPNQRPDDFGTVVIDSNHRGEFHFVRNQDITGDPFTDEAAVARLALAARCTASFPGAFEASFCPVNDSGPGPDRPDMEPVAGFRASRYVIDGGVLVNKPLGPALEAIFAQKAQRQVRRVLAYVVPDPGTVGPLVADDRAAPPTLAKVVVDSVVTLPRHESIAEELRQTRVHNREIQRRRNARDALIVGLGRQIIPLAIQLVDVYRVARRDSSVRYMIDGVVAGVAQVEHAAGLAPGTLMWDRDKVTRDLLDPQVARLPWIPQPPAGDLLGSIEAWDWGLWPIERMATVVLDVLRRAMVIARFGSPERTQLGAIRGLAHDLLTESKTRRAEDKWQRAAPSLDQLNEVLAATGDAASPVARQNAVTGIISSRLAVLLVAWPAGASLIASQTDFGGLAMRAAQLLVAAAGPLRAVLQDAPHAPPTGGAGALDDATVVGHWADSVEGLDDGEVLRLLLAFEVVEGTMGENRFTVDQLVELIQISADVANPLDPRRATASTKLAGVQLAHFGAFLKRSWRANDWLWGRLDGATKLAQVVLSPARLRQLYPPAPGGGPDPALAGDNDELGRLRHALFGPRGGRDRAFLEGQWEQVQDAGRELDFLRDPGQPVPSAMPEACAALARRLQLGILRNELGAVAEAVSADVADGASPSGRGVNFQRAWVQASTNPARAPEALSAPELVSLLQQCDVGLETVHDELGSDLLNRTASTALADAVSLAYDKQSGTGLLRNLARAVRAPVLVFWLLIRNATGRGRTGPVLNAAAIAIGATLVAVSVFTKANLPLWLVNLAWAVTIAAVLVAFVRSLTILVLVAAGAGTAWSAWVVLGHHPAPLSSNHQSGAAGLTVVIFALIVLVLGSVRQPRLLNGAYRELRQIEYGFAGTTPDALDAAARMRQNWAGDLAFVGVATGAMIVAGNILGAVKAQSSASILVMVGLAGVIAWLAYHRRRQFAILGLDRSQLAPPAVLWAVIPAAVAVVAIGLLWRLTDLFTYQTQLPHRDVNLLDLAGVVLATGMARELVFRGVLLAGWARLLGRLNGLVVTSVAYGLTSYAAEYQRLHQLVPTLGGWDLLLQPLIGVGFLAVLSAAILCPVRLLSRGIVAPALFQAAAGVTIVLALAPHVHWVW